MTLTGAHVALERGADAAYVPPASVDLSGVDIFCVYVAGLTPHIWTRAEVAALGERGVRAVLPIVVPNQFDLGTALGEVDSLVAEAADWGVPRQASLCLDVEYSLSAAAGPAGMVTLAVRFVQACAHFRFWPWLYAGDSAQAWVEGAALRRWLAEWPRPTPTDPQVPAGFDGWQYANGPYVDLDVFRGGLPMMTTDATTAGVVNERPAVPAMTETAWLVEGSHGWYVTGPELSHLTALGSEEEGAALSAAGYRQLKVPVTMVDRLAGQQAGK